MTRIIRRRGRNKFGAIKTEVDGIVFHSKLEATRYRELALLQKLGKISDLKTQVRFPLAVNNQEICNYIADFVYNDSFGLHIEDTKGVLTDIFKLKAKLFKAVYGREIELVYGRKNNRHNKRNKGKAS